MQPKYPERISPHVTAAVLAELKIYELTITRVHGPSFSQQILALSAHDAAEQAERILTVNGRYSSVTIEVQS